MSVILTLLAALIASGACAYHRSSLRTWAIATGVATLVVGVLAHAPVISGSLFTFSSSLIRS